MIITRTKILNDLIWLLTVFLVSSFLLFDQYGWGKYSFIACSVLIYALSVVRNGWRARLRIEVFHSLLFLFILYVALTAVWTISASETLTMARTLIRIWVCLALVYWVYMDDNDPIRLISTIIASSYVVAFYSFFVYGFSDIMQASDDALTSVKLANINSIALFLSFGVVCDLFLLLYHGAKLYSLLSVLSVIIIAFTRSRKAIIFLVIGTVFLLLFRSAKGNGFWNRFFRVIGVLILVITALYFISHLSIFSGVNMRLQRMLNTFMGSGKIDSSTLTRNELVRVGWKVFINNPLGGVGMNCTHYMAYKYLNVDAYLHNNYVELLAGGGIFAFIIYYSMHVYLLVGFIKLKNIDLKWCVFGILLIVLLLITDYGRVAYYSKVVYFELMALFLILRIVRRNGEETVPIGETDEAD